MSARILDCTQAEYFADPCAAPSLSQSIATTLVTQSPLHAWSQHPRLGAKPRESTDATTDGKVLHSLLLGKGVDVQVIHADSYRKKAVRAERDEAIAAGRTPMLEHEYEAMRAAVDRMRSSLLGFLKGFGIFLSGQSEVAIEWMEPGDAGDVQCRGMLDHLVVDRGVIYDLKKIRSAHPKVCARHMTSYGYDIQWAAYTSALAKLRPDLEGRIDMVFLFMELDPPYAILPVRPGGMMRELGQMRWSRAVRLWERCLNSNTWPGYAESIVSLDPPAYALNDEIGVDNASW
jgi:hypothetical protein